MRRRLTKERVVMSAGLALSALLAFYFLRRVDLSQLGSTLASVNLWILSLCLLTKGAVFSLGALRSKVFLRPLRNYHFAECFTAVLGGYVTDNIFPFRLGELVRIDLLARAGGISRGSTVAVAALERLLDLVSFLILFAIVVPLLAIDVSGDRRLAWGLGAILGTLLAVGWLVANPSTFPRVVVFFSRPFSDRLQAWLFEKAQRFVDGFSALRSSRAVAEALALSQPPGWNADHSVLAVGVWARPAIVRSVGRDGLCFDWHHDPVFAWLHRHVSCRMRIRPRAPWG